MKIEMGKKYKQRNGTPVRVLCVDSVDEDYPVIAITPNGNCYSYTVVGNYVKHKEDVCDTPYADFKVDDKVMVREYKDEVWLRRHFAGTNNKGMAVCFNDGGTSWTCSMTSCWAECRKPTPEELAQ